VDDKITEIKMGRTWGTYGVDEKYMKDFDRET
jgi:hypothetical protein